jgi:hypothetical protein
MWREAINLIEGEINSLAARKLESAEFAQAANQFSKVSLGVQHVFERSFASALRCLELPSRSEVDALASAVQRIEDKLDQLLPSSVNPALVARPSRTRRPSPPPGTAATKTVPRTLKPAARRAPKED